MSAADWELVCGLEVHAHLKTRTKMFCRCALEYGAAENTHTCPVCLAHPGALPVPNGTRDRDDDPARPRARLRDRRARRLRAQELLLSRPAEGLPDQPVRGPALRAGPVRPPDRRRRPRDRDRARAPRGGRGEDRPRRRRDRPLGRRRLLPRRLQPRRHAAARDRQRARPPLGRGGDGVPRASSARRSASSASPTRTWRRARCAPTSTSRCAGAGRRAPAALGDQEHELLPLHRARDRGGVPAAGRRARGGGGGRPVDIRLRPRHRPAHRAPLEGGGRRLPLLPRARPRPGRAAGGARRAAARASCPSGRPTASGGSPSSSASRRRTSSSPPATRGRRRRSRPKASTGRRPRRSR